MSLTTSTQTTYGPRLIDIIEAGFDIGLQDYPIFDEDYRETLNQSIVDHFLLREIGAETPALFIFYLNRRMRENMPKANALYQFYEENKNNLVDEYLRKSTGTDSASSSSTSSNESTAHAYASTNPQINMDGRNNEAYYNSGTFNDGSGTADTEGRNSSSYEHIETGRNAGVAAVAAEFDSMFQDVDQIVFEFLEPCFTQLYTDHYNGL